MIIVTPSWYAFHKSDNFVWFYHSSSFVKSWPVLGPADLRPISVMPIFSRIIEWLVAKTHNFPKISTDQIQNQNEFKPTGSTTTALTDITHSVSMMLEENKYVQCLLIDFTKTFDSVDHAILINKLRALNIDHNIISRVCHSWLIVISTLSFVTKSPSYEY